MTVLIIVAGVATAFALVLLAAYYWERTKP